MRENYGRNNVQINIFGHFLSRSPLKKFPNKIYLYKNVIHSSVEKKFFLQNFCNRICMFFLNKLENVIKKCKYTDKTGMQSP